MTVNDLPLLPLNLYDAISYLGIHVQMDPTSSIMIHLDGFNEDKVTLSKAITFADYGDPNNMTTADTS
jgi:hypothetical protein